MKLQAYAAALVASLADQDKALAPARAAETQKKLEVEIAKLDIELLQLQNNVTVLTGVYPLNVASLTTALDQIALKTRARDQLSDIVTQLFPAETPAAS